MIADGKEDMTRAKILTSLRNINSVLYADQILNMKTGHQTSKR